MASTVEHTVDTVGPVDSTPDTSDLQNGGDGDATPRSTTPTTPQSSGTSDVVQVADVLSRIEVLFQSGNIQGIQDLVAKDGTGAKNDLQELLELIQKTREGDSPSESDEVREKIKVIKEKHSTSASEVATSAQSQASNPADVKDSKAVRARGPPVAGGSRLPVGLNKAGPTPNGKSTVRVVSGGTAKPAQPIVSNAGKTRLDVSVRKPATDVGVKKGRPSSLYGPMIGRPTHSEGEAKAKAEGDKEKRALAEKAEEEAKARKKSVAEAAEKRRLAAKAKTDADAKKKEEEKIKREADAKVKAELTAKKKEDAERKMKEVEARRRKQEVDAKAAAALKAKTDEETRRTRKTEAEAKAKRDAELQAKKRAEDAKRKLEERPRTNELVASVITRRRSAILPNGRPKSIVASTSIPQKVAE